MTPLRTRKSGSIWVTAIALAVAAGNARAELPLARLAQLLPAGGQIGTTFELSANGSDLDDATELRFSDTNVTARCKINADSGLPEPGKFIVTISSNALPARSDVRIAGRFGISNPRGFAIGQWPEVSEKSDNHSPEKAMDVSVNSTVNGQADANAIDHYRFVAKKGQRLLIDCRSGAIDSRIEPILVLLDAHGREIDRSRRDGLLDFTAAQDGTNLLKVSDLLYRGGAEFQYRLTVHTGPQIDWLLPAAALPGTTNKHTIYGRNLPGGSLVDDLLLAGKRLEKLDVEIPAPLQSKAGGLPSLASLPVEGFEYRLRGTNGISEPVFVGLASAPVVLEQAGNDRPDSAQKIAVPCDYSGQLYPAGDQDWVTFDAKKGEVYWIEVFAQRIGSPVDPFFLVQRVSRNDKGESVVSDLHEGYDSDANIGGREFRTSSFDPAWRFEVKEDGAYRVQVRDLFNRTTSDPRRVYRLSIRKEAPDFRLVTVAQQPLTRKEREVASPTVALRRGETIPVRVLALRRDNFGGEITVSAAGLPAGVTCTAAKIEAGKNSCTLLFTAREDATNSGGVIKVVGKARVADTELTREAAAGFVLWPVGDYNNEAVESRAAADVTLGVVPELAPVGIEVAATNSLEAVAGTKLKVPLAITRRGEFNDKLKLKLDGASGLDSVKEIEIDGKATNAIFELDLGQAKLSPGTYTLYFQTQAKGKYRNNPEGAKQAEAAAKEAEKIAVDAAAEAKKVSENVAALAKAATDAEAAAKAAAEKLNSAKTAAEANAADTNLTAAKAEAEKALATATEKARAAVDAKAAAERSAAEAAAKAKSAEARKTALAARAKELAERSKSRELTASVYSRPFELKVSPAPPTATAKK